MCECRNNATTPSGYLARIMDGVLDNIASNNLWLGVWGNSNTSQVAAEWVQVRVALWAGTVSYVAL